MIKNAELVEAVRRVRHDHQCDQDDHLDTLAAILHLADTAPNPMTQQLMRGIAADALTRMGAL